MNIAEILKYCNKGTKLYSPIFGEVTFNKIDIDEESYPIIVYKLDSMKTSFTKEGHYTEYPNSECVLFPSKEQRDWSKFVVSDQVTDQKQETELKPFDKVLARDEDDDEWVCDIFSHIDEDDLYYCVGTRWKQCIAYNGNEHLLGTTNKPE